jgi:hypothetical protein
MTGLLLLLATISLSVSAIRSPLESHKNVSSSLTSYYYYYYYYYYYLRALQYEYVHISIDLRINRLQGIARELAYCNLSLGTGHVKPSFLSCTVLVTSAKIDIIQVIRLSAASGPFHFTIHNNSVVPLDVL